MPIAGIEQPEIIGISEHLRLRRFDGCFDFAFEWYQDPETVWLVDGVKTPYTQGKLNGMYRWLDEHGELYFIEVREDGAFRPIGDVCFWKDDMPIVIGKPAYRCRGIGAQVVSALIERAKQLGYSRLSVNEIYDYNAGSRRCFERVGFRVCEKTERGVRMKLDLVKMEEKGMQTVTERFLRYVSFDTMSDEFSETCPSSDKQKLLGAALVEEMRQMGIRDARMDENGYVYGTVPGDPEKPTIGLIAHMDTSPDASGADIKAKIVEYTGEDICLNGEKDIWLREADYPALRNHVGKHLIVTDGTTLLGADDKAGVAEIMAAAEYLLKNGGSHATLKIGFTPDEEIGRGADRFDVAGFGADYAYTADGGPVGEIEYENFNAASAKAVFRGLNIHPGSAKDKMVNSQLIAMEFQGLLPVQQRPEYTEGYEGFIHLTDMEGQVERSVLRYIVRDHDMEKFQAKKAVLEAAAEFINRKYGEGTVELTLKDSYFNMKKCIEPCMYVVDRAMDAMKAVGMEPKAVPIRGGTDGARLSYEGLPCPNLCTGGENYHGRFEYIPVEDMEQCVRMLVRILTDAGKERKSV